ncbi:MAG TPA: DUF3224 domain-containing protein [Thermoanaerobaculia bacterium]|nr:DUF3224 domain-containing protein [Thermoanaerobaculia bacterium]
MGTHAAATFEVKSWDEKPYEEIEDGKKLTRASVVQSCHGDIEGEAKVEYLMAYRSDGTASFVGLQRVIGSVGGRAGSFVLQIAGSFDGTTAKGTWFAVAGSGTGELQGLRGEGGFAATHGPRGSMTLDYDIE